MQKILKIKFHFPVLMVIFLVNLLMPIHAGAHANSYGYMDIEEEQNEVKMNLALDYWEIGDAFDLPINLDGPENPPISELETVLDENKEVLTDYIFANMNVYRDELVCTPVLESTSASITSDNYPLAHFHLNYPCSGDSTRINYELFIKDINNTHINFVTVAGEDGVQQQEFTFSISEREMTIGDRNWMNQAWNFIVIGMEHIVTGYDHVLFILCLILPAAIKFRSVIEVVTAFTLGHSITLGLATLEVVSLPGRLVEIAIAISIVYVALENLFKWQTKHRWLITLFFGLIHGFGFAGIMQEMELSRSSIASSLLFFNVGVEVGQLAIILLVFPLLLLFRKYQKQFKMFVSVSSIFIAALGMFWIVQRVAGIG